MATRLRGLPDEPVSAWTFDVVVVVGGVPRIAATLKAARLGERVALVHNRPYLGGNASVEIGLRPRGLTSGCTPLPAIPSGQWRFQSRVGFEKLSNKRKLRIEDLTVEPSRLCQQE